MRRRDLLGITGMYASCWALAETPQLLRISTLLETDPASELAVRVLDEAYRRAGLRLALVHMPGERSLLSANSGETDGELYRRAGIEAIYGNLVRVPVALMSYEIVASTLTLPDLQLRGWQDLRPYRLGYVKGIKIIEENTRGYEAESVASMQQALRKLQLGRSQLVLANRITGLASARALGLTGLQVIEPPLASFPVFHYLNKRHRALLEPLTGKLRAMQDEGMIRRYGDDALAHWC